MNIIIWWKWNFRFYSKKKNSFTVLCQVYDYTVHNGLLLCTTVSVDTCMFIRPVGGTVGRLNGDILSLFVGAKAVHVLLLFCFFSVLWQHMFLKYMAPTKKTVTMDTSVCRPPLYWKQKCLSRWDFSLLPSFFHPLTLTSFGLTTAHAKKHHGKCYVNQTLSYGKMTMDATLLQC